VISQLPTVLLLFQAVISVDTELVAVPVTDARRVNGLGQKNFRVLEDAERSLSYTCRIVRPVTNELLIRRDVAPPSPDFTTYIEGELVRVSIPSNWRELPDSNAVTFAPEGADGSIGLKSVFTHGLRMGLARNDKRNLRVTTSDFIRSYVHVTPTLGRTFRFRAATIGDRPGLHTVLSTLSEATGRPERIEMFTTLLRDGTMFYVLAVAPVDCVSDYEDTFRRVVESIEIMDRER
jgi:hypothetical protein